MKITLFLPAGLINFNLPQQTFGSYSFDADENEESKLINIEAENSKWVIYQTTDVQLIVNNEFVNSAYLAPNYFYILRRNNINYLIYISVPSLDNLMAYTYSDNSKITIGTNENNIIRYNCNFLGNDVAILTFQNNTITLTKPNTYIVYRNNLPVLGNEITVNIGDQIYIYGLKIIILKDFILINNPGNNVNINTTSGQLTDKIIQYNDQCEDKEIKDEDLYSKNEYFSKPPRIRRVIEKKTIKIDAPPKTADAQEMPLILTIGPMLGMGITSILTLFNTIIKIKSGETTLDKSWTGIVTGVVMLLSSLLWPLLTKFYTKHQRKKIKQETIKKYTEYLERKKAELKREVELQKNILQENLIDIKECENIIKTRSINFWDKRIEQSDFLVTRLGIGNTLLEVDIQYPEQGFTIEEDNLRKQADEAVAQFKYIENVPIGYSFYQNNLTAIMGEKKKSIDFINNIILQLITFYSYEDLKFVLFTNEQNQNQWEYLKYLNHNFDNNKRFRFFSANQENAKDIAEYLNGEIEYRVQSATDGKGSLIKPYYVIIIDDYDMVKRFDFVKKLTELDNNIGFSVIVAENRMSKIPSKCVNFITLGEEKSSILQNSYEKQETAEFTNEIDSTIDMNSIVKILSNIPIEFEDGNKQLPDSITFLEMEKVSKVEQLNILNRWNQNNSTISLKAEVGVDENEDLMYLDLHEKRHGPHGLIAGMTGSGKSEFIITYILSMAMNYSPDDVAFILIDYKGGGLAFAFENQATGISLPHLAGTITNLDKAEMNRTLVSIDSEIKRRQRVFNDARDKLGKSTIDIYKYQQFYKEGKLLEPVPHLFIICDEFAELKSQQPEFMDNLISVARIGRSLGVHLILATQKPSGVVNDQIWSNTRFRVCLKVQSTSDSNEMLKRPDAASIKQTGRFYLQVGYDEYFALGQSAWCGAKYYPSDKIIKSIDKSINFIDNTGNFIKNIQAGSSVRLESKGEQLSNILTDIIEVAKVTNKKANRLWLPNIPAKIYISDLIKKYNIVSNPYEIKAIIGEYDAPEKQEQGILMSSFNDHGNTIIYGNDGTEREMVLNSIIYSTVIQHSTKELNYYIIDYGSEVLRKYEKLNHIGGIVFSEENEKLRNLFKLINKEIVQRKKIFSDFGGEYNNYISQSGKKLPLISIIINNYDAFIETNQTMYDELASMTRDCERYGIIFIITCNGSSSISRRVSQNFETIFALHFNDPADYYNIFNARNKLTPQNITGRGLICDEDVHEFQTSSIVEEVKLNQFIQNEIERLNQINDTKAPRIPSLPEVVNYDLVKDSIKDLKKVPIGVLRESLEIVKYNFTEYPCTIVSSNKLDNQNNFIVSLIEVISKINNVSIIFFDIKKDLSILGTKITNYISENLEEGIIKTTEILKQAKSEPSNLNILVFLYGASKLKDKGLKASILDDLSTEIKTTENANMIICDSARDLKNLDFDKWYSNLKNSTDGIWVGKGLSDQTLFRLTKLTKEMSNNYTNDFGYIVSDSNGELAKLISFNIEGDNQNE